MEQKSCVMYRLPLMKEVRATLEFAHNGRLEAMMSPLRDGAEARERPLSCVRSLRCSNRQAILSSHQQEHFLCLNSSHTAQCILIAYPRRANGYFGAPNDHDDSPPELPPWRKAKAAIPPSAPRSPHFRTLLHPWLHASLGPRGICRPSIARPRERHEAGGLGN